MKKYKNSNSRAHPIQSGPAASPLQSACQLFEEKQYEEALNAFQRILSQTPEDLEALNRTAKCLQALGHQKEAEAYFLRALALQPQNASIHNDLGMIFIETGRTEVMLSFDLKRNYEPLRLPLWPMMLSFPYTSQSVASPPPQRASSTGQSICENMPTLLPRELMGATSVISAPSSGLPLLTTGSWSSYAATVGAEPAPAWLEVKGLLAAFGSRRRQAIEHYIAFVRDGQNQSSPWSKLRAQVYLGGEDSLAEMQREIAQKSHLKSRMPSVGRWFRTLPTTSRKPTTAPSATPQLTAPTRAATTQCKLSPPHSTSTHQPSAGSSPGKNDRLQDPRGFPELYSVYRSPFNGLRLTTIVIS